MRFLNKKIVFSVLFIVLMGYASVFAALFYSRKQAIKVAFPTSDKVDTVTLILTKDEQKALIRESASVIDSRIFSYYVGKKGGKILGYAFIETHVVRTMPEAIMTVLSPDGAVEKVFILAFYEPQEYMPSALWLKQFLGKTVKSNIRLNQGIQSITGATLSCRAITKGVKKNMAFYKLKILG